MDGIKCILLDIEGTVLPISFVKDTLFPYALNALPKVLETKWDDPAFKQYRDAFPQEHRKSPTDFQAHVEDLTKRDVKIAYLKNLQGYLWEDGYKSGAYSTNLFQDVVPQLQQWKSEEGLSLAIYSSGSVFAQKLLFGHVQSATSEIGGAAASAGSKRARQSADEDDAAEDQADDETAEPPSKKKVVEAADQSADGKREESARAVPSSTATTTAPAGSDGVGKAADDAVTGAEDNAANDGQSSETEDLTALFDDWFDTTNAGLKTEAPSYVKIAGALKLRPEEILFLSDNVKEIDAAHEAKMNAILVERPGNAEVAFADRSRLQIVESLKEIYINKGQGTEIGKEE